MLEIDNINNAAVLKESRLYQGRCQRLFHRPIRISRTGYPNWNICPI